MMRIMKKLIKAKTRTSKSLSLKKLLIADLVLAMVITASIFCLKAPGRISGLTVTDTTYNSADLSWDEAKHVTAYHVYRSDDGKSYDYLASTSDTSYTDTDLETGQTYYYRVATSNGLRRRSASKKEVITAEPSLDMPDFKVSTDDGQIRLSFEEVEGATGYEIYCNDEVIAETSELEYTDTDAAADQSYEYAVRAYRETGNADAISYSALSDSQRAELVSAGKLGARIDGSDAVITWSNDEDYDTFSLYKDGELVAETEATSIRLEKIKPNTTFTLKLIGKRGDKESPATVKSFSVKEEGMTNKQAIDAACDWGVKIANDDSFTYGAGKRAHHFGCYFCGTNVGPNKALKGKSKVDGHSYAKTYCCNPFVSACFAHGAGDPTMLKACKSGHGIGMTEKSYTRYGCWKKHSKPAYSDLKRGDVLVKPNHVALYIGDGKYVQASGEGWGKNTISVSKLSKKRYGQFKFIMRYTGSGSGKGLTINETDAGEEWALDETQEG